MSSGTTHRSVTIAAAPLVTIGAALLTHDLALSLAAGVGCYAGVWIHPDWDINHCAPLWRYPYARLCSHRGMSHTPIIGTLTRLLYVASGPILALVGLWYLVGMPRFWIDWRLVWLVLAWVGGLCVSDILHWVWDRKPARKKNKRYRVRNYYQSS